MRRFQWSFKQLKFLSSKNQRKKLIEISYIDFFVSLFFFTKTMCFVKISTKNPCVGRNVTEIYLIHICIKLVSHNVFSIQIVSILPCLYSQIYSAKSKIALSSSQMNKKSARQLYMHTFMAKSIRMKFCQ